uniref:LOW QUALITY PROTEIN: guanylyl cyclase-activating protein 1 n=1 Tax=Monopterus albus TaxID=43700 RepID=UPI0009B32F63|nr:LOW QUALITY PROTEIN: guanylyl cyclase-activating protein 1-like [Monopterus albus]
MIINHGRQLGRSLLLLAHYTTVFLAFVGRTVQWMVDAVKWTSMFSRYTVSLFDSIYKRLHSGKRSRVPGAEKYKTTGSIVDDLQAVEMHLWCKKFTIVCPSGQLTLHDFKQFVGLRRLDTEAKAYIEQMFHTFDMNKKLVISLLDSAGRYKDFMEYVAALGLVMRGKIKHNLYWYFNLYDVDGNGCIGRHELLNMIKAPRAINENQETTAEDFTNGVFDRTDINGDGEPSLEESVASARRDADFREVMMKSLDLTHIAAMIYNRSCRI